MFVLRPLGFDELEYDVGAPQGILGLFSSQDQRRAVDVYTCTEYSCILRAYRVCTRSTVLCTAPTPYEVGGQLKAKRNRILKNTP